MSDSRVQVLTLAELAFTILFAVIILSLPEASQAILVREQRDALAKQRDKLAADLDTEKQKRGELERRLANVPAKLSNIPPPCSSPPLEHVTIVGSNAYVINGVRVDANTINARHAADFAYADNHKCHHRIVVSWSDELSATGFATAMQQLERNFYIMRAGSVAIH